MKRIFTVLIVSLFLSLPAFADETVVEETKSEISDEFNEVVVSASRYEEDRSSVPANVTIMTEEDIDNSTAHNIPELIRGAGIQVSDITSSGRRYRVDTRGFGDTAQLNTVVLIDGRNVNLPDLLGVDWTQIPLENVERVEIIKGGRGSVLYGDNATGGVINIITKKGKEIKSGGGLHIGSYGTRSGNAYLRGSQQNVSYSLLGNVLTSKGYREQSDVEAKDIGLNLNFDLSHLSLNFGTGYHRETLGLPGPLKESDFAAGVSRKDSVKIDEFDRYEDYYFKGSARYLFGSDTTLKLDSSFRRRASFSSFSGGSFTLDSAKRTFLLSPQMILNKNLGKYNNILTFGYDYQESRKRSELKKNSYGYYLHDEIDLTDSLSLSGGYRVTRADFDFLSFAPGTLDHTKMTEDSFTVGINYNYGNQSSIYLNLSKNFRIPSLDEFSTYDPNTFATILNTDIIPQKSDDYELGIVHQFTDKISANLNIFRIDTENEIFFNKTTFTNENLDGETNRKGIEITANSDLLDWLSLKMSYTYLDIKIKGGQFSGKQFPGVAKSNAYLGTLFDLGNGFTIALDTHYVGKRYVFDDFNNNFEKLDDHFVLNSKIKYHLGAFTLFLDINNLFDKEYSEYGVLDSFQTERAFYPSPERNILLGISANF